MTAISREYIHAEHWHNTIVIETGTISSVDFNMSEEEKEFLFMKGFETALKFIPIKTSLHK
jgi:NTE family protein